MPYRARLLRRMSVALSLTWPACRHCSRMHAIERHREVHEQAQMDAYAAAVEEQRRRSAPNPTAADAQQGPGGGEGPGTGDDRGGWQHVLRLDPIALKLQRSKLARLAFRRCGGIPRPICTYAYAQGRTCTALP